MNPRIPIFKTRYLDRPTGLQNRFGHVLNLLYCCPHGSIGRSVDVGLRFGYYPKTYAHFSWKTHDLLQK